MSINDNQALLALLGTMYGGDGRTTFALPDLRGRVALGNGQGPGLPPYAIGQRGGTESTALTESNLPPHDHGVSVQLNGTGTPGTSPSPAGAKSALSTSASIYGTGANVAMAADATTVTEASVGGGQPISNVQPYLTLNTCINMVGIFPPRS